MAGYVIRQVQHTFKNLQHIRQVMCTTRQLNLICGPATKGQPENLQTSTEGKDHSVRLAISGKALRGMALPTPHEKAWLLRDGPIKLGTWRELHIGIVLESCSLLLFHAQPDLLMHAITLHPSSNHADPDQLQEPWVPDSKVLRLPCAIL